MGKVTKYNYEEWINKISKDLPEDYQIGLHQIGVFGTEESKKEVRKNNPITYLRKIKPKDYCESIMKTGLRNKWEDIMYTLYQFGSVDKIKNNNIRREEFLNYQYKDDMFGEDLKESYNIIVAMPRQVTVDGDKYLLGHLSHGEDMDKPEESAGKRIFSKSDIPKEFIYGYIYKHDGIVEFTPNKQHIKMKTAEEQERFFEDFVKEKNIEPRNDEEKENIDSQEDKKRGPIEALKEIQIERQKEILSLLEEKEKMKETSIIPYKKFSFFEKHILKRREYREYMEGRKNAIESNNKRNSENRTRLQEINKLLLAEGSPSISSVKQKIDELSKATSIQDLGVNDPNKAMEMLVTNGIDFKFESYQQAFEFAPDFFGENVDFMKKAIREDMGFIKYDKTNNEELYKEFIEIKIKYLEDKKEDENLSDKEKIFINRELEELSYFRQELEVPKNIEEGKYKLPHKFMFEEIRNNAESSEPTYYYRSEDGVYDIEFGQELETLYENPEIIVGVHGLRENDEIENSIFKKGLKNSMQDADIALNRTVAFGENMTFTKLLNYRIPYNGLETESAVILTLPKNVLDKENPVPIWGSHNPKGSDNYILPQYVYGLYHGKSDGENRKIILNTHREIEKYEYLKYDSNSSKAGIVEEVEKQQNSIE